MGVDEFGQHDFDKLKKIFIEKPFQGQYPDKSKVLFVGQDANYPKDISNELFKYILEYHENGVCFWKKYGIHHPFLLPEFKKEVGGIAYHKKFTKLCLGPKYAEHISFVELTDIPTFGNTGKGGPGKFSALLTTSHIIQLQNWILNSGDKLVFMPRTVMSVYLSKVYKKTELMKWLIDCDKKEGDGDEPIKLFDSDGVIIYKYNHFSGAVSNKHIDKISIIIRDFLSKFIAI
jgi:hypothetical protein